jgi:hypothetical protein
MKPAILAVLCVFLACPPQASAQGETAPPAKEPAPPLFPRHRRGLYRSGNGPTRLDATPQSPPLEIDDPGVPDKGKFEINLTAGADMTKTADEWDLFLVDANYGLSSRAFGREIPMQAKFEFPISGAKETGQPLVAGVGALRAGLKFIVYDSDRRGMALSLYPQLEFTAGAGAVERGLADAGQTVILPVLVEKELSQFTLVFNAGIRQPLHDPDRTTSGTAAIGVGRAITRKFVLMAETRVASGEPDHMVAWNAGAMRSVGDRLVVYANIGHSAFSGDRMSHTFAGIGLKVMTDSVKK